jgi:RNA polymerase-binding transcription factor DksA
LVEAERRATQERIASLRREVDEIMEATAGANTDDEHDPEGSTIAFERERVGALLHDAEDYLGQLNRAAAKLEEGTFGRCEICTGPIAAERLAALPAARTCIACAGSPY